MIGTCQSACDRYLSTDGAALPLRQTAELLQQEQQQLGEVIEAEFQSQVSELRRAADRWQQRLAEAERRHQTELADQQRLLDSCRQQRETDLQELHRQSVQTGHST